MADTTSPVTAPDTVAPLRASMKFSLWAWALYWPGCGLLLWGLGMQDPTSIAVVLVTTAGFLLAMATGALRTKTEGPNALRQHLVDRPLYLLAILTVFMVASAAVPGSANAGLILFSALYLASIAWIFVCLRRHLKATGSGYFSSGADQLVLLLGGAGFLSLLVFIDALSQGLDLPGVGAPNSAVGLFNVLQILYPVFLLVAARPFREPLRLPRANTRIR